MTRAAERSVTEASRDLTADLAVSVTVGSRSAAAQIRARPGHAAEVVTDDAALLFAEASRGSFRRLLQDATNGTDFAVRRVDGRELMRTTWDSGRMHRRWSAAGLFTVAHAGWIRVRP